MWLEKSFGGTTIELAGGKPVASKTPIRDNGLRPEHVRLRSAGAVYFERAADALSENVGQFHGGSAADFNALI